MAETRIFSGSMTKTKICLKCKNGEWDLIDVPKTTGSWKDAHHPETCIVCEYICNTC